MKNVIERAVVLATGEYIDHNDLVLSTLKTAGDTESGGKVGGADEGFEPTSLADMEQAHILQTLNSTGWNKSRAAGILGIERSTTRPKNPALWTDFGNDQARYSTLISSQSTLRCAGKLGRVVPIAAAIRWMAESIG